MGIFTRLVSFSFKLTLVSSLLLFGITLLPDHFFGHVKFDPQPKEIIHPRVPADVKIIKATADQLIKLDLGTAIIGPESLKFHNKFIYTGTVNGQILKIDEQNKKVSVLTTLVDEEAKNCENVKIARESCGRALDLEIVGNTLYAVDTFRGFIQYDLVKNTKTSYDLRTKIPGYESTDKTFNSIRQDPTNPNIIYISLSSTKYGFNKISHIFLEHESSGILIAFNKATNKATVIGKNYILANGLEITDDKKSLLINDLVNQRIMQFDLKAIHTFLQSSGKGALPKSVVFKSNLPGYPDNITKHGKHLLVALFWYVPNSDTLLAQMSSNIHVRNLTHRLLFLASETLKIVSRYCACDCLNELQHHFESAAILMDIPYHSGIAIIDQNTADYVSIIDLPLQHVTHAIYEPSTGDLYLGSIKLDHIKKLSLKL